MSFGYSEGDSMSFGYSEGDSKARLFIYTEVDAPADDECFPFLQNKWNVLTRASQNKEAIAAWEISPS